MLKKILIVLAVVVGLAVAYVASRPSTFVITRSTVIPAPVAAIYPRVVDFKAWDAWSPWAKLDPAMKVEFTGTPGTVGHGYHWVGNDKVGEGRMTITEVVPDRLARIKLEFIKPWAQVNTTDFGFVPDGNGTKVTWTMRGDQDFVGKAFSVFIDIDKAVGSDFEKGLSKLKEVAKE